ncbi:hypothetical protein V8D89_011003 [Ganoderma adspersum]
MMRTNVGTTSPRIGPHSAGRLFLPLAAYDIMEDYFFHQSQWPDKRARLELARRVNVVLRCCCYSVQHVYMRFAYLGRREKIGMTMFSLRSPRDPLLTRYRCRGEGAETRVEDAKHSVVAKLDVLLEEEPSPTPEVAAIWADVLAEGVLAEDIITYALLRQVKKHMVATRNESKLVVCAAAQVSSHLGASSPASTMASTTGPVDFLEQPGPPLLLRPHSLPERKRKRRAPIEHSPVSLGVYPGRLSVSRPRLEPESRSSSRGTPCTMAIEAQELAVELRQALSAPVTPHPKTFSELCTWLRGSVNMTTA